MRLYVCVWVSVRVFAGVRMADSVTLLLSPLHCSFMHACVRAGQRPHAQHAQWARSLYMTSVCPKRRRRQQPSAPQPATPLKSTRASRAAPAPGRRDTRGDEHRSPRSSRRGHTRAARSSRVPPCTLGTPAPQAPPAPRGAACPYAEQPGAADAAPGWVARAGASRAVARRSGDWVRGMRARGRQSSRVAGAYHRHKPVHNVQMSLRSSIVHGALAAVIQRSDVGSVREQPLQQFQSPPRGSEVRHRHAVPQLHIPDVHASRGAQMERGRRIAVCQGATEVIPSAHTLCAHPNGALPKPVEGGRQLIRLHKGVAAPGAQHAPAVAAMVLRSSVRMRGVRLEQ